MMPEARMEDSRDLALLDVASVEISVGISFCVGLLLPCKHGSTQMHTPSHGPIAY